MNNRLKIGMLCLVVALSACDQKQSESHTTSSSDKTAAATKAEQVKFDSEFECEVSDSEKLIISEVVAKSDMSNFLDGSDWLELQNISRQPINLNAFALTANNSAAVTLPDYVLSPCEYYVIPAREPDSDSEQKNSAATDRFYFPHSFKKEGLVALYFGSDKIDELPWSDGQAKKGRSIGRINGDVATLYPTPGYKNVPYILFSDSEVFTVKIDLSEEYWQNLQRNAPREFWYPAEFTFNGAVVKNVYVRTKGSSTLDSIAQLSDYHESHNRFSFKVKFNRDIDQKFMGMKRLAFNNGYGDPTLMRDVFSYRLLKEVGAPASEISYVDLWVRDQHMGLYQMVELIDSEYVEKYFADDKDNNLKGDLYKAFSSLEWEPDYSLEHYTTGRYPELELKTNRHSLGTKAEGKALMAFLKSINTGSSELIDIENMARYVAAMVLISNYDSYFANLGNYYLYEHRSINAFTMLPWDFNLALGRSTKEGKTCEDTIVFIDHPTIVPIEQRPILARLFEREDFIQKYHGYLKQLLGNIFNPEDSRAFIHKKMALIDPYVKKDLTSFYSYSAWKRSFTERVVGGTDHFGAAGPLLPFIDARYENVRKQLSGELPSRSSAGGACLAAATAQ